MHGDTAHFAVHELALPSMQTSTKLQSELAHALGYRAGAAHGSSRAIEAREEAIACHVELRAAKPDQLAADQPVVLLEQLTPRSS